MPHLRFRERSTSTCILRSQSGCSPLATWGTVRCCRLGCTAIETAFSTALPFLTFDGLPCGAWYTTGAVPFLQSYSSPLNNADLWPQVSPSVMWRCYPPSVCSVDHAVLVYPKGFYSGSVNCGHTHFLSSSLLLFGLCSKFKCRLRSRSSFSHPSHTVPCHISYDLLYPLCLGYLLCQRGLWT